MKKLILNGCAIPDELVIGKATALRFDNDFTLFIPLK
jgi:hypothetical protein